jgi:putative transposase
VKIEYPNHVWGIDITYIRLRGSWMYLVAVLDWFSRFVVSWELDQSLEMPFVVKAVERALQQAAPKIWNSDQGSHFTSSQYIDRLLAADVLVSMDGKGRAIDNIFTERLWRSIKYEEVYLKDYASPREARLGISSYFDFYNYERPHQSLDYQTPAQVYFESENFSAMEANGCGLVDNSPQKTLRVDHRAHSLKTTTTTTSNSKPTNNFDGKEICRLN